MKNIILFVTMSLFATISNAQDFDRIVYWVHGLGGDDAAFSQVANATTYTGAPGYPARRAYSNQIGYVNQSYSLNSAAGYVNGQIFNQNNFNLNGYANNFIIAHSQGGLVARALDKYYSDFPFLGARRVGGLVTFGTPHQGARILNNIGLFNSFISSGCVDLAAGVLEEAIPNGFFIDLIIPNNIVSTVTQPICALAGEAAPLAFNDFTQPITDDYRVGAPALAELNNFQSNIPKVAFYGIEDEDNVLWKILYNVKDRKPNSFPAFEADDDNKLVLAKNANVLKYQAKVTFWQNQWSQLGSAYCNGWQWFFAPAWCIYNDGQVNSNRNKAIKNRDAWAKGANWWTTANDKFRTITGALEVTETPISVYECNCTSYDYDGNQVGGDWIELGDENGCPSYGWLTGCTPTGNFVSSVRYNTVPNASDGIVLAESAKNFPGAVHKIEMMGSNHQQMRNDSNTRDRLNELWRGDYGSYFITAIR